MKKYFIPQSNLGKWSVRLIGFFFFFMLVFYSLISSGYRGGDTFFSNPPLAISIFLAGISGIASFVTGVIGIMKNRERSLLVIFSVLIGLFVIIFISGEILSPH